MNTRDKVSEIIGNAIAELKKLDLTQDDFPENAGVVLMSCIILEDGSLANQQAIVGAPSRIQATITMHGSENLRKCWSKEYQVFLWQNSSEEN